MREIKFRAWLNGSMYYGHSVSIGLNGTIHFLDTDGVWKCDIEGNGESIGVKLMQYTGLKENAFENLDLNKCIYDGDIIQVIDGTILSVEWNDDTCSWQFSDGSPLNNEERYATHKAIIGNIYETPELLK